MAEPHDRQGAMSIRTKWYRCPAIWLTQDMRREARVLEACPAVRSSALPSRLWSLEGRRGRGGGEGSREAPSETPSPRLSGSPVE